MPLNEPQRKFLRRLGHDHNPIVLVGQGGVSPNVIAELDRALRDHELVKVRARVGDRNERDRLLVGLAAAIEILRRKLATSCSTESSEIFMLTTPSTAPSSTW